MERGLYIVPTPVGNLKDVSQRVIEVLGGVTLVAAEDTRHCRQLLQHLGVEARVTAFHEHSNEQALQALAADGAPTVDGARGVIAGDTDAVEAMTARLHQRTISISRHPRGYLTDALKAMFI